MNGSRVIRKPELQKIIGLSDVTIWRMEKAGKFPKRISLGANSVGWFENDIEDWFADKAANRISLGANMEKANMERARKFKKRKGAKA